MGELFTVYLISFGTPLCLTTYIGVMIICRDILECKLS